MPVVRRADDDGVDVLACDELAVVVERPDLRRLVVTLVRVRLLDELHAVGDTFAVEIAHGDVVGEIRLDHAGHVVALRDASEADLADANAIVRPEGPRVEDERRRDDPETGRAHHVTPRENQIPRLFLHGCSEVGEKERGV
jgi:hypothetical protein